MPSRTALVDHCLELLAPMGDVTARSMFGGHGLRIDGVFMALIAFDRLFLKADTLTRPQFVAAGCEPFVYAGQGKPVTMSYWTVPPQAMESPADMQPWARLALDAALRARLRLGVRPHRQRVALRPRASLRRANRRAAAIEASGGWRPGTHRTSRRCHGRMRKCRVSRRPKRWKALCVTPQPTI